jgi:acyl-CoA dehydrogenase
MDFNVSQTARELLDQIQDFSEREILPRNREMLRANKLHGDFDPPFVAPLRKKARELGLWNFAMTELDEGYDGQPLSNVDYAVLAEYLGRILWSSKIFNCQWPDVPNMVALQQWATPAQKEAWLRPMLDGHSHSAFAMTEPAVASSDATNIATRIKPDGDHYIINGSKWYITGATHPKCQSYMVLGITDPDGAPNRQHSVVMVPRDTPGVIVGQSNSYFGFTEPNGPASSIRFEGVRVPVENRIGKQGEGFAVAQARLAPARLHHCMRAVGQCELLVELMMSRGNERVAFGAPVLERDTAQHWIAQSRVDIQQMRLLVQHAAWRVDQEGARAAFRDLAILKVGVATAYHRVAERAVQLFGAMGGNTATPIAEAFAWSRAFRIGDGPDEVHLRSIYRREPVPTTGIEESIYFPDADLL